MVSQSYSISARRVWTLKGYGYRQSPCQDFFCLTHPCFELWLNKSEEMTPRTWANPCSTNVPKTHHKTSDPKIFISHIALLNLAGAALHITLRMCANPSWTNVPKHTTNFRSELFHLTHPCFELYRNRLPCYTTHMSQPILYQRPKIQHKWPMTHLPRYTSQNFNVHRIGVKNVGPCKKTRSNENLCATFRSKKVLSKLQWLKLPAPNLLQKCSREVFSWTKTFGCMVNLKSKF